jgi:hypothetical protein
VISALPLASLITGGAAPRCAWPECAAAPDSHGLCRLHALRVRRGATPGCETDLERLAAAALSFFDADSENDRDFAARLGALVDAAFALKSKGRVMARLRLGAPVRTIAARELRAYVLRDAGGEVCRG